MVPSRLKNILDYITKEPLFIDNRETSILMSKEITQKNPEGSQSLMKSTPLILWLILSYERGYSELGNTFSLLSDMFMWLSTIFRSIIIPDAPSFYFTYTRHHLHPYEILSKSQQPLLEYLLYTLFLLYSFSVSIRHPRS